MLRHLLYTRDSFEFFFNIDFELEVFKKILLISQTNVNFYQFFSFSIDFFDTTKFVIWYIKAKYELNKNKIII